MNNCILIIKNGILISTAEFVLFISHAHSSHRNRCHPFRMSLVFLYRMSPESLTEFYVLYIFLIENKDTKLSSTTNWLGLPDNSSKAITWAFYCHSWVTTHLWAWYTPEWSLFNVYRPTFWPTCCQLRVIQGNTVINVNEFVFSGCVFATKLMATATTSPPVPHLQVHP